MTLARGIKIIRVRDLRHAVNICRRMERNKIANGQLIFGLSEFAAARDGGTRGAHEAAAAVGVT